MARTPIPYTRSPHSTNKPPQAPKNCPPAAKQAVILSYLQTSLTAHTLKELEKALPSVASINGLQVKDYLQALSDDGKIRIEKIGSGNWYWSFASEEKKTRTQALTALRDENTKLHATAQELRDKVAAAAATRADAADNERAELVAEHARTAHDLLALKAELDSYRDGDPGEVGRKQAEVVALRARAERWTDNVVVLEQWVGRVLGGDRERLEAVRSACYGVEYVPGEGLGEL